LRLKEDEEKRLKEEEQRIKDEEQKLIEQKQKFDDGLVSDDDEDKMKRREVKI
jgi:hypothetical protein